MVSRSHLSGAMRGVCMTGVAPEINNRPELPILVEGILDYPNAKMIWKALDILVFFTQALDMLKILWNIFLNRDFLGYKWSIIPNIYEIRNSFPLWNSPKLLCVITMNFVQRFVGIIFVLRGVQILAMQDGLFLVPEYFWKVQIPPVQIRFIELSSPGAPFERILIIWTKECYLIKNVQKQGCWALCLIIWGWHIFINAPLVQRARVPWCPRHIGRTKLLKNS